MNNLSVFNVSLNERFGETEVKYTQKKQDNFMCQGNYSDTKNMCDLSDNLSSISSSNEQNRQKPNIFKQRLDNVYGYKPLLSNDQLNKKLDNDNERNKISLDETIKSLELFIDINGLNDNIKIKTIYDFLQRYRSFIKKNQETILFLEKNLKPISDINNREEITCINNYCDEIIKNLEEYSKKNILKPYIKRCTENLEFFINIKILNNHKKEEIQSTHPILKEIYEDIDSWTLKESINPFSNYMYWICDFDINHIVILKNLEIFIKLRTAFRESKKILKNLIDNNQLNNNKKLKDIFEFLQKTYNDFVLTEFKHNNMHCMNKVLNKILKDISSLINEDENISEDLYKVRNMINEVYNSVKNKEYYTPYNYMKKYVFNDNVVTNKKESVIYSYKRKIYSFLSEIKNVFSKCCYPEDNLNTTLYLDSGRSVVKTLNSCIDKKNENKIKIDEYSVMSIDYLYNENIEEIELFNLTSLPEVLKKIFPNAKKILLNQMLSKSVEFNSFFERIEIRNCPNLERVSFPSSQEPDSGSKGKIITSGCPKLDMDDFGDYYDDDSSCEDVETKCDSLEAYHFEQRFLQRRRSS